MRTATAAWTPGRTQCRTMTDFGPGIPLGPHHGRCLASHATLSNDRINVRLDLSGLAPSTCRRAGTLGPQDAQSPHTAPGAAAPSQTWTSIRDHKLARHLAAPIGNRPGHRSPTPPPRIQTTPPRTTPAWSWLSLRSAWTPAPRHGADCLKEVLVSDIEGVPSKPLAMLHSVLATASHRQACSC